MEKLEKYPPNWTDDNLSEFLEKAYRNTLISYSNLKYHYSLLQKINNSYKKISNNLNDTEDFNVAGFLIRSHSLYLGAIRLGLSGQLSESYLLLRACLENALYGIHIKHNPGLFETWIKRDDSEENKKMVRNEFTKNKMLGTLKSEDNKLSNNIDLLYERTITLGAHPNEKSIITMMNIKEDELRINYHYDYLVLIRN